MTHSNYDFFYTLRNGRNSDMVGGPFSANKRLMHCTNFDKVATDHIARSIRASISSRSNVKSIGFANKPSAPPSIAFRLVSGSP